MMSTNAGAGKKRKREWKRSKRNCTLTFNFKFDSVYHYYHDYPLWGDRKDIYVKDLVTLWYKRVISITPDNGHKREFVKARGC